ncbi:mucin-3A-like [Vespa velutina]|uniref:mucin-3A-like n=1 Tax=Vespa velutina TaxID=202808 RepID=UPI001FB313CA|nr:mucin-3A-like [Vespa velutina]
MKGYKKSLMFIVASVVAFVDAFKNGRSIYERNFPGYQGPRQYPPYHEQHRPFREQPFGQSIRTYRQPTSYREHSPFRNYSSLKNFPSYRESPFQNSQSSSLSSSSSSSSFFGHPSSPQITRASFGNEYAFHNEHFKNRLPSYLQSTRNYFPNELRHSPTWITSYRSGPYGKTVDTYEELEKETRQRLPFDEPSNYLKYGNHGLGFALVPDGFDENTLPLDTETSTTLSTTLTATHKPLAEDTVSATTQTIPELHSSSTTEPKIVEKSVTMITTTSRPNVELKTLGNAASGTTNILLPTMPSMSATPKQYSSDDTHIRMTLTTVSNSSDTVTESPVGSFDGNSIISSDKQMSAISPSSSLSVTLVPNSFQNGFYKNVKDQSNELSKSNVQQSILDLPAALKTSNQDNAFLPLTNLKSDNYQDIVNLSAIQQSGVQDTLLNLQNSWKNTLEKSVINIQNSPTSSIPSSLLNYLISREPKNNVQDAMVNYILPTETRLNLKDNVQSKIVDYVMPEDSTKDMLKNNLQNTYLNYILQGEGKRSLPFQPLQSGTFNYVPMAIPTEQKLTLPISTLSSVANPMENINYIPKTSYLNLDPTMSSRLTLDSNHPESLSGSLQGSLSASIPNSIPGSIPASISAAIPGTISTGIPTNIPTTMEFAQTFQQPTQIRPLQTSVTPYSGMQLQLGGFGGIDYGLRSSSPEARPMELGIAKVGLAVREFPRPQNPTFAKIGFGQSFW